MKQKILLLLLVLSSSVYAQDILLFNGTVLDTDKQPIPFAHLMYKTTFAVSDTAGRFVLAIPANKLNDTLLVSSMGFATERIAMKEQSANRILTITLLPETYEINGVTINNNRAKNHWLKALQKLETSLPNESYTYPALYRQVHKENGTYVRLIEAGMTVYDVAATYKSAILQERFRFEQIRRSDVWERNGDAHGDHLVDMFLENNLRYPAGTIMDASILNQFDISYYDSHCTICGDSLELLVYHYEKSSSPKILDGKIWLYKGSLKLFALEENASHNPQYYERGVTFGGGDNHWMFKTSKKILTYAYIDGKVYLKDLQFEYLHHIHDRALGMMRYEITESFSLYCDTPALKPYGFVPDRNYTRSGNLYSRKYAYEESFWRRFPLAVEHPLPEEVSQTFSDKMPLAEQFRRNGE